MDSFEDLTARLLRNDGHWTVQSRKVDLTREEKVEIGLPSMPRPEIDILAYRPDENVLFWVECKSFLDSPGVRAAAFEPDHRDANTYRVFTNRTFRRVVSNAVKEQVTNEGLVRPDVELRYCLVAGHFYGDDQVVLQARFDANGWLLRGPDWVSEGLRNLSARGYENDLVTIAVKLLARNPPAND